MEKSIDKVVEVEDSLGEVETEIVCGFADKCSNYEKLPECKANSDDCPQYADYLKEVKRTKDALNELFEYRDRLERIQNSKKINVSC